MMLHKFVFLWYNNISVPAAQSSNSVFLTLLRVIMPKIGCIRAYVAACIMLLSAVAHSFGTVEPLGLDYAGIYRLRQLEPALDGKGVTIASVCRSVTYVDGKPQNDYLFNIDHNCFYDNNIEFVDGTYFAKGVSKHATYIGGILSGYDPKAFCTEIGDFAYEGAAYRAEIDVYEFWRFVSMYIYGEKQFDADVMTLSVGSVFDRWWTRGIERYIDRSGLVVVAGIGNGSVVFDPVLYPGASSNVIGVGVIDLVKTDDGYRYALPNSEHTSTGPTSDSRCGPDIVAPGNMLVPDSNSTDGYGMCGDWSSFAAPVVTGSVALLMQKAESDPDLTDAANNKVMRAILLNSARKLPYWHKGDFGTQDDHEYAFDFLQGAGAIDTIAAYNHLIAGRGGALADGTIGWDENAIERIKDSQNIYKIDVTEPKGKYITATLVWNRHYLNDYPFDQNYKADTDLRLEVWGVNEDETSEMLDYCDSVNDNVEHVFLPVDPNFVSYDLIVKVSGAGEDGDDYERYGFAWSVKQPDRSEDKWKYDVNTDGKVDNDDLLEVLIRMETKGSVTGDINLNGVIDVDDVLAVMDAIE